MVSEGYVPKGDPFWTDGEFSVWERSEGKFTVARNKGGDTFRGDLAACAAWIERNRGPGKPGLR